MRKKETYNTKKKLQKNRNLMKIKKTRSSYRWDIKKFKLKKISKNHLEIKNNDEELILLIN